MFVDINGSEVEKTRIRDFNFPLSMIKMQTIATVCAEGDSLTSCGPHELARQLPRNLATHSGNASAKIVSGAGHFEVTERKYKKDVETEPTRKSIVIPEHGAGASGGVSNL